MKTSRISKPESGVPLSNADKLEIAQIYLELMQSEVKLIGTDGKTEVLPTSLYSFLCRLLADIKEGHSVTILQSNAPLTTMEASRILGMSRQFFVELLERNELPFHKVGTHRRVYVRDLLAYKAKRDAARRLALDSLTRSEFEEGIYQQ